MFARHAPPAILALACGIASTLAGEPSPLDAWKNASVRPVLENAVCHTIHTYYVTSPESPDGKHVLVFMSADRAGYKGDVAIVERATGKTTILARNVVTEDAHRVACQQWLSGGRRVVFQDLRDGEWVVAAVDVATGVERVLAGGRQVGIGSPSGDVIPVIGLHWQANDFADIELLEGRITLDLKPYTVARLRIPARAR